MNKYVKPENIADDMGGSDTGLDNRMREIFDLLEYVPKDISNILDIGFGRGQIPFYFKKKGKMVTSIGLELESYGINIEKVRRAGIKLVEANVEEMPFPDDSFDCVVASHIFEHVLNLGKALEEVKRVLKTGGWFILFIPKYTDIVCAGHVNTGWNIGQLIYVLGTLGWDVKNGHFIEYGYSLCAMVQVSKRIVPGLRGDKGDIQILNDGGYFPFEITGKNGERDSFDSRGLMAVNWEDFSMLKMEPHGIAYKIVKKCTFFLYKLFGIKLERMLDVMQEAIHPSVINPKRLK